MVKSNKEKGWRVPFCYVVHFAQKHECRVDSNEQARENRAEISRDCLYC